MISQLGNNHHFKLAVESKVNSTLRFSLVRSDDLKPVEDQSILGMVGEEATLCNPPHS